MISGGRNFQKSIKIGVFCLVVRSSSSADDGKIGVLGLVHKLITNFQHKTDNRNSD
uniref:Uncharacterized protein n=1 Tax=Rhizophagus irregularis (strain DAOM 181602 / DAOM 197198 / MUCL 43194) TaxID=747089 RepID=U9T766_RHIID